MRKAASLAGKKCERRMIKKGMWTNPASTYDIGEKVLLRYPLSRKIASKRCILEGRIYKRNLNNGKYKARFTYPVGSSQFIEKWIPLEDITSITLEEERTKRQKVLAVHKKETLSEIPHPNVK